MQDKDEFFEYFRKALSKRLLSKTKQYNENSEKSFLSKLKSQSGDAAIRKLQGMFTDVQVIKNFWIKAIKNVIPMRKKKQSQKDESIKEMSDRFNEYNGNSNKVGSVEIEVQVSQFPVFFFLFFFFLYRDAFNPQFLFFYTTL